MTSFPQPVISNPAGAVVSPVFRAWLSDRVLLPVTVVLLLVTAACAGVKLSGSAVPMPVQLAPFAVSILVFGLPHGALDHLVPARLRPGTTTVQSVSVIVLLYLSVGAATAALWAASPLLGFAVFIGITWFHWGQGDLFIDRLLGDRPAGRHGAAVTIATRGALPMLVPFITQPTAALLVVTGTAATTRTQSMPTAALPVMFRAAAGVVVVGLVVLHLVGARRHQADLRRQATEDLLLLVFFAIVPPVLAVGLYFTLWHAVRHILRLELTDQTSATQLLHGHLAAPFVTFMRRAWPITLIAVSVLILLGVLFHRADLGIYLVFIAALTTPHALVVTWMDHVQHIDDRQADT